MVLVCLTSACVVGPPEHKLKLDVDIPAQWQSEHRGASHAAAEVADWWTSFGDPNLNAAVERALAANWDLKGAQAQLRGVAAGVVMARADRYPRMDVGTSALRQKQNFIGFPIPGDGLPSATFSQNNLTMSTSWEVDLWGRISAESSAAVSRWQATSAELAALRLAVAGGVVKTWFSIAESGHQVAIVEAMIEKYELEHEQIRSRYERGLRPALDMRLSSVNLASTRALLQQHLRQRDAAVRRLQVLSGAYPDGGAALAARLGKLPDPVPAGLPAELVGARPDLIAAEKRLTAADAAQSVARRSLYPRLTLTASGGTASPGLGDLLNGNFSVWGLAANLLQPVFQGGRLKAGVQRAQAESDVYLARYVTATLNAYGEVETALRGEQLLRQQLGYLDETQNQAKAAWQLAEHRYLAGVDNYLPVLETQRGSLQAQTRTIAVQAQLLRNRVDLHLALGGGFSSLEEENSKHTEEVPSWASE